MLANSATTSRRQRSNRVFLTILFAGFFGVVVAFAGYWWPVYSAIGRYEPRAGDVIFQSLQHARLVNTIEGVTQSPYSHCGLVARRGSEWVVVEALDGVEETPLREFLLRGRGYGFSVYRLRADYESAIAKTIENARSYLGSPYDARYRMDDENIYCSELIWKAYRDATAGQSLGELVRLGDLNWRPYVEAIKYFEEGPVPLDREMITPWNLARAEQFHLVMQYEIAVPESSRVVD